MKPLYLIHLVVVALLFTSCSKKESKAEDAAVIEMKQTDADATPVSLARLDLAVLQGQVPDSFTPLLKMWLQPQGKTPEEYAQSAAVKMFTPQVQKVFPADVDTLSRTWAARMSAVTPLPQFVAVVVPFRQSILLTDSVAFVGLNHYLGADHEAYSNFAEYQRRLKTPSRLLPDLTEALTATAFPMTASNPTLLQQMLYQGALVETIMEVCRINETEALGYTPDEAAWAAENEANIWNRILTQKWLFSTDATIADRLLQPSPASTLLNPQAPGRIARWMGHRLVRAYIAAHPGTSVQQLLSPTFYVDNDRSALSAYTSAAE